jgi:hypothetical protein
MAPSEIRRYERIDIELPCRLFIPGADGLRFEAYATSRNLGLGGVFVATSFLLRKGLEVHVELALPEGPLPIRSRIAHVVGHDDAAPLLLAGPLPHLLRHVHRGVPAPAQGAPAA